MEFFNELFDLVKSGIELISKVIKIFYKSITSIDLENFNSYNTVLNNYNSKNILGNQNNNDFDYKSITSIAESTLPVNDGIKNLFCGIFVKALPYIFNFLDFLKTNGANIEVDRYKAQLKDMNLNSCFVQSF